MIGEIYFRQHYPVGCEVMLKTSNTLAAKKNILPLENIGTILSFTSYALDTDTDDGYDGVEILWDNGVTTSVLLNSLIHAEDKQDYIREQQEFRAIGYAILDNFIYYNDNRKGLAVEWFESPIDFKRKIALMNAGVSLTNVKLYDELSVEELQSLKHHVRAMEGEK